MTGYALTPMLHSGVETRVCTAFVIRARTILVSSPYFLCLVLFTATLAARAEAGPEEVSAPEFSLSTLAGEGPVSMAHYRGKIVFLDFWASWCGPCRKSLPLYETMYREFDPDRFVILAISLDEDPQDAWDFLERHPISYTVLSDPDGVSAEAWGLKAMPTSFLVNSFGELVEVYPGFKTSHMEVIRNDIEKLLEGR